MTVSKIFYCRIIYSFTQRVSTKSKIAAVAFLALSALSIVFVERSGRSYSYQFRRVLRCLPDFIKRIFFANLDGQLDQEEKDYRISSFASKCGISVSTTAIICRILRNDRSLILLPAIALINKVDDAEVGISSVFQAVFEIPSQSRQVVMDRAAELFSQFSDFKNIERAEIIRTLRLTNCNEPKKIAEVAINLQKRFDVASLSDLLQILLNIPSEKLDEVVAQTIRLIEERPIPQQLRYYNYMIEEGEPIKINYEREICDVLAILSRSSAPGFVVNTALRLRQGDRKCIRALSTIPVEKIEPLVLLTEEASRAIGSFTISSIFFILIKAENPEILVRTFLYFIEKKLISSDIGIINKLASIKVSELEKAMPRFYRIVDVMDVDKVLNFDPEPLAAFLKQLESIPEDKLEQVMSPFLYLLASSKDELSDCMARSLKFMSEQADVSQLVSLTLELKKQYSKDFIFCLFEKLSMIEEEKLTRLLPRAQQFFSRFIDMSNLHRANILHYLNRTEEENIGHVIDATFQLCNDDAEYVDDFLSVLCQYNQENLTILVPQALRLMRAGLPNSLRLIILRALRRIPLQLMVQEVNQIAAQIPAEARDWDVILLLENAVMALGNRQAGLVGPAAAGINVHNRERETRTAQALQRLKAKQGDISEKDIGEEVSAFKAYLEFQEPGDRKTLAIKALCAPKTPKEWWGPLLGDDTFTVMGFTMPGDEIVARLWRFSNTCDETERENARQGMIAALSASFEYGQRVCNPGKVQRLVTSVLQGRLDGATVDPESEEIKTPAAMRMFFLSKEELMTTRDRSKLVAEAEAFCLANPKVKKEEFMAGIEAHMRATGF